MKYVALTTCEDIYQAYFVQKELEFEGIACMVMNEHTSNLLPLAGPMAAMIEVRVLDVDYVAARNVLDKLKAKTDTVTCPNCGSTKVVYGLGLKHRVKRIFVLAMAVLFWVPVAKFHLVYHCEDCHTEFRKNKF